MLKLTRRLFGRNKSVAPQKSWRIVGKEGNCLLVQEYHNGTVSGQPFRVMHGGCISG